MKVFKTCSCYRFGNTAIQAGSYRLGSIILLTLLFSLSFTTHLSGKGCSGTYFIRGTAYSADKTVLKNTSLRIEFGKETKTVLTDSNGHYEIEISWINACPSGRTKKQHRQDNKKINPPFIYIHFADKEIKLENKWDKYADCFPDSKDAVTWEQDLHFSTR